MIVGIIKEIKIQEHRVALTPKEVAQLSMHHSVLVQSNAGLESGFSDEQYQNSGASIISNAKDIWLKADLIIKVKEPQEQEYPLMRQGQMIFTFFHFAGSKTLTQACLKQKITALAYETLTDEKGNLPLLAPMSAIAGKMAALQGAKYLEKTLAGKGILVSGLDIGNTHIAPANAIVLGGGIVGTHAATELANLGAKVTLLELDKNRIKSLKEQFNGKVTITESTKTNLYKLLVDADIVIGAVLVAGKKAPKLILEKDLALMQKGTVLVDVAIDQGGCFETSHPTTHNDPVFTKQGIVHYCVANLPGAVNKTSSLALAQATIPYIKQLADLGLERFLAQSSGHKACLNMQNGALVAGLLS